MNGCATVFTSTPPQSANEQFLLSQAASKAIHKLSAANLRGRTVFVSTQYLDTGNLGTTTLTMPQFLIGDLRAHLLAHGARLVNNPQAAQITLEVRCGALSLNQQQLLIGIPAIAFGNYSANSNFNLPIVLPQIALLQNIKQHGYADIGYVAYWTKTGEIAASSGPYVGRTYRSDWWILGFGPQTSGDIPPVFKGRGE